MAGNIQIIAEAETWAKPMSVRTTLLLKDIPWLDYPKDKDGDPYKFGVNLIGNNMRPDHGFIESDNEFKIITYYREDNDSNRKALTAVGANIIEYYSTKNFFKACYIRIDKSLFDRFCDVLYANAAVGIGFAGSELLKDILPSIGIMAAKGFYAEILEKSPEISERLRIAINDPFKGSYYGTATKNVDVSKELKEWYSGVGKPQKMYAVMPYQDHLTINQSNNTFDGYIRCGDPAYKQKKVLHLNWYQINQAYLNRGIFDKVTPDDIVKIVTVEQRENAFLYLNTVKV